MSCRMFFGWQRICLALILMSVCCQTSRAQLDPERRRLLQFGYNQPLEGRGPMAGYAFFYLNEPDFGRTNLVLRLVLAPVYLDSELGIRQALGPNTDVGIGVSGGGFADSYSEIRQGKLWREESFTGHGAEVNGSIYHLFNPQAMIPLNAIFRVGLRQSFYSRDDKTDSAFVLPEDQSSGFVRAGLRWGGKEPLILPEMAMELSVWYEGQLRSDPGSYGYAGDRELKQDSHLFWTRALLAYTLPKSRHNISVSITGGASLNADRLSAYRLGGVLPMGSEFPLSLPGYYFQELTAERFLLIDGQYTMPLDKAKCWYVAGFAGTGLVDYLPGLEQPGHWHSGVGGGITYESPSRSWMVILGYGYGFDAIRGDERGAQVIGLFCQFDLESFYGRSTASEQPRLNPSKFRGFDWLLGR
jgi:hypothetical protein